MCLRLKPTGFSQWAYARLTVKLSLRLRAENTCLDYQTERSVNDMDSFLNILLGVFCSVVFFVILTLVTLVIRCIFCTGYIL